MWTPVLAIERGHKALAADLAKLVHAVVPPNDWEVRLEVYATLRESLGVEAALKWAETGLTQGDVWAESNIYASGGFLSSRATPELLFRFLKFAEDDENADVARACRARAIAEGYPISAEERTRLEKDIAVDDRIYHRIARYYLGLTPEAELVSGAKTPFERSATAAAIGRMRIRDRRYADASRHLRYAIEVGSLFNVERIESYTPLLAWDWTGQTLTSLERVGAAPLVDTESPLVIFSSI